MREQLELGDNAATVSGITVVGAFILCLALAGRSCTINYNATMTERCKALVEAKADAVTTHSVCSKVSN